MDWGFFAGGASQSLGQGFNSARQMAIQQAYLKLQQQHQDLLRQAQDRQVLHEMAARPDIAGPLGEAYSESEKYRNNPESYSYQPPDYEQFNVPPGTPDYEDLGAVGGGYEDTGYPTQTVTPSPVSGQPGYEEMLKNAGSRMQELNIDAEARKMAMLIERLRAMGGLKAENAYATTAARNKANYDTAPLLGRPTAVKADATRRIGAGFIGPETTLRGVASGKVVPPAGGVTLPPPPAGNVDVPGAGGLTSPTAPQTVPTPPITRRKTPAEQQGDKDLQGAINFVDGMLNAAEKGGPGTGTGQPLASWTKNAQKLTGVPGIGNLIKTVDPNIGQRAAFHEAIGQNFLAALRTNFKSRISNYDILFGKDVIPSPEDGPEAFQRKLAEFSMRLHMTQKISHEIDARGGVEVTGPMEVPIPPGGFTGNIKPSGMFSIPGTDNLGTSPVPAPPQHFRYLGQ